MRKLLTQIKERYFSIPENIRTAFYCTPLFFTWLPGISFETGQIRLSSIRSFLVSLVFFAGIIIIFLFESFIWTDSISTRYARELVLFILHSVVALLYVAVGFTRSYLAFRQGPEFKEFLKFPEKPVSFMEQKLQG